MIRRLLRDRPLRDAVKRAHYRATVPDPTWTPEEAFDAWLRERENVDRMTAAFHGAQDKLRTARRACDHWKARAEHLASEKSEADMRYADTRYLLEGMARKLVATRKNHREASTRIVEELAEYGWMRGIIGGTVPLRPAPSEREGGKQ